MFGLGKKKVDQAEFESELEGLLRPYLNWQGGSNPDAAPTLISRLAEFKRIVPDLKANERLHRAVCDVVENQIKAMSHLDYAMLASGQVSIRGAAKEYHTGETYLAKMNRAAEVLVGHVGALDESDPVRKLLIDYEFYEAEAKPDTPTADADRQLALKVLRVVQLVSARQQLALEEWNDANVPRAFGPLGDEVNYEAGPLIAIDEFTAPRLLPVAERRRMIAQAICDDLAKMMSIEMPEMLRSAVSSWSSAFDRYLERCEIAAHNVRALTAGTETNDVDEDQLRIQEGEAVDRAIASQQAVMNRWGIDFEELLQMMYEACNEVRLEIGKPELSKSQWMKLYSGEAGPRPRFYA